MLHYSCRDRNLLGIQSDLLGAHAMGLRNVLLITGDPGRVGDYPDATAVFDVDSIGLTNLVSRLNHGYDVGGQAIGAPTAFHIGVSVNPVGVESRRRAAPVRVQGRGGRGVRGDAADFRSGELRALSRAHRIGAHLPIIAGVFPFDSARNAEFMANEVPGVRVPDALMERIRRADGAGARRGRGDRDCARDRDRSSRRRSGHSGLDASGNIEAAMAVIDGLR